MPDDGGVTFGVVLRRFRLAAQLSQEALAERARMSVEAISALERGVRRAPQAQTLKLLIEGLELDDSGRAVLEAAAVRPVQPRNRGTVASVHHHNLPTPLSTFVGREREITAVAERLKLNRLVTLVGAGGVGKSRLAVETARAISDAYDAVWIVELASMADGRFIASAIAGTLGLREEPPAPLLQTVVSALRSRHTLLVLDNCEHLLDATAIVVNQLLSDVPNLSVLITSREALHLNGEHVVDVRPLQLHGAAEMLFIDRATAVAPSFSVSRADWKSLRTICERLDGIPLAIELAAARASAFDLATIAQRLEQRFSPLASGARTALPHHRTLRALFDWSYGLLTEDERRAFRGLSVFAGGWTLEAAEIVMATPDMKMQLFDILSRLHDKSLVHADHRDGTRFHFLQTIRDYALDKLEEANERYDIESQFVSYYLELASESELPLRGSRQNDAVAVLAADMNNLRAALDACERYPELQTQSLRALSSLARYYIMTGTVSEGYEIMQRHLERPFAPSPDLAMAFCRAAYMLLNGIRLSDSMSYARRALDIAASVGDGWTEIYAALALFTAQIVSRSPVDASELTSTLQRAEASGDEWLLGHAFLVRGLHAVNAGDVSVGRAYLERSLATARKLGDSFAVAGCAVLLTRFVMVQSEPARAAELIVEAATLLEATNNLPGLASCLEALAAIALGTADAGSAARFLGGASALREKTGTTGVAAASEMRRAVAAALGEQDADAMWLQYRELDVRDVIHLTKEWLTTFTASS